MNIPSIHFLPATILALLLPFVSACRAPEPAFVPEPTSVSDALAPATDFTGEPPAGLPGEIDLPDELPDELTAILPDASLSRLFILRWNPDISAFTDATFREGFDRLRTEGDARTNWSIHDWPAVRPGDWGLFVRVGGDDDGIAGLCRFLSPAYKGASWRGDGTTVHYADIDILLFNDPSLSGLFPAAELDSAFPAVDWHGGHSGSLLDAATAEAIALHVADHLARTDTAAIPSDALTIAPLGDDAPRALACTLLADLSPAFNRNLSRLPSPILPAAPVP